MHESSRVLGLGNEALLSTLVALASTENQVTSELLVYLGEFDARRLFEEHGFSSMFAFCTQSLGLCDTTAWRRLAAARVCRQYPEACALIASGALKVSTLSLLEPHVNAENAHELFEACLRVSFRKTEELLAARFPKPDQKDSFRRLPTRTGASNVGSASAVPVVPVQHGTDLAANREKTSPPAAPVPSPHSEVQPTAPSLSQQARERAQQRLEPLSTDRFAVRFTADTEFRDLLEQVRALASHRLPSGDLKTVLQRGLEAYRRELEKKRFAVGKKPRARKRVASDSPSAAQSQSQSQSADAGARCEPAPAADRIAQRRSDRASGDPPKDSRYIPAAVAREVYIRDAGQCTFISQDGHRCESCRFLEFDHVVPYALGGQATVQNLRLRCGVHNRHHARACFGADFIARKRGTPLARVPSTDAEG